MPAFYGTLERYWHFYTVTSLAWDAAAAMTNAALILLTGRVALRTFRRFEARLVAPEEFGSDRRWAAAHDPDARSALPATDHHACGSRCPPRSRARRRRETRNQ